MVFAFNIVSVYNKCNHFINSNVYQMSIIIAGGMIHMKQKLARLLALTMVLMMAVCSQSFAEGKTLRLTQNVEMDTLDSGNTGDGYTTSIMSLLVDSLFRLDANSQPQPSLAESYEVSEDGLVYTFHLRDSKWSNGDDVTAADFEY